MIKLLCILLTLLINISVLLGQVTIKKHIYFEFAKSEISPDYFPLLNQLVDSLNGNPHYQIALYGHTDSIGSYEYNLSLSKQRAETVRQYFIDKGIKQSNISYKGHGFSKQIVSNQNEVNRSKNRRVEINLEYNYFECTDKTHGHIKLNDSKDTFKIEEQSIVFSGKVYDQSTAKVIDAEIIVSDITGKELAKAKNNLKTGEYTIEVKAKELEENYYISVYAKDYFFGTELINTKKYLRVKKRLDHKLAKLEKDKNFILNNILFFSQTDSIKPFSNALLITLTKFMKRNRKLIIQIEGHTNSMHQRKGLPHQQLSTDRALKVYDHLINNKIKADRLTYVGYGSKYMIETKPFDYENHRKNMRVEIKVIDF